MFLYIICFFAYSGGYWRIVFLASIKLSRFSIGVCLWVWVYSVLQGVFAHLRFFSLVSVSVYLTAGAYCGVW